MKDLPIDPRVRAIVEGWGITRLHEPQAQALVPALAGDNVVLAIPTASGKSLVAYLALAKAALEGRPGLYIVPLRALASEKVEDLRAFESLGLKIKVATGELDESDTAIRGADIVVATSEKADSLMRHRSQWMDSIGCVIADEVHLIHDMERGPTIEVLLAKVKMANAKAQLIALSATIENAQEIAGWLNAELIASDFRPVVLKEGVSEGRSILFADRKRKVLLTEGDPVESLVVDSLKSDGQCLVFVNSRRSAVAEADRLRTATRSFVSEAQKKELEAVVRAARSGEHSELHDRLARCVADGVAFHHAGLAHNQRAAVEQSFKRRQIKTIVATPTLAAGVNLPAKRVIVRDLKRYEANLGQVPLPVLEVKQMCGRAGRPKYDKEGEAILLAKTEDEMDELMEHYIYASPERIFSKLGTEPALRSHLLAAIATGFVNGDGDLDTFLASTFLAHQTNGWDIEGPVQDVLEFLHEHELIRRSGADMKATNLGRRVSELYIDPLTAVRFLEALDEMPKRRVTDLSWLHLVSSVPDASVLYMRDSEWGWVQDLVEREASSFLVQDVDSLKDDESFLSQVKTAQVLQWWVEENSLDSICTKFDIGPGDIRTRVDTARWLLWSLREVARVAGAGPIPDLVPLARRVVAGVKGELLPLVAFRGIGRLRARSLWARGYRSPDAIRAAKVDELGRIPLIGPRVAVSLKDQVEGTPAKPSKGPEPVPEGEDLAPEEAPVPATPAARAPAKGPTRKQKELGDWPE